MPRPEAPLIFSDSRYPDFASRLREDYRRAQPFPHVVMDDFLPKEIADRLLGEFPAPDSIEWTRFKEASSVKQTCRNDTQLTEFTRLLLG